MMHKGSTYIIAEAGVNHNGSLETGLALIDVAAEAGADAVKFQTFKAANLVTRQAEKATYQKNTTDQLESQQDMLKRLELNERDHRLLMEHCNKRGIAFLSTPFDLESLDLLVNTLKLKRLKLPSGEITNGPLLLAAAQSGRHIILSTGMSDMQDIQHALGVLAFGYIPGGGEPSLQAFTKSFASPLGKQVLREKVCLLHCTTEYPAPVEEVNLNVLETMTRAFGLTVGYSDHTPGINVSLAAVAKGARIIEKHFTLDKTMPGPDHQASLEPGELKGLVTGIREVEKALGSSNKTVTSAELKNRPVARKSLVAAVDIPKGGIFTTDNLTVKRPGTGVSPMFYWEWLSKKASRDYSADEVIE